MDTTNSSPRTPSEPDPFGEGRAARRLRAAAEKRLEKGEELVCWARAWVSIDGPLNVVFAARTRDYAVLTTRRLMLWSTGFLTRHPRRRVLADRLDEITVERVPPLPGRRLRITSAGHRPLRLELGRSAAHERFVEELLARTEAPTEPDRGTPQEEGDQ